MRNYLFSAAMLLASATCFSQPAKDSLLAKDYKQVEARLILMHYLDRTAINYFAQHPEATKNGKDADFILYYNNEVVNKNPALQVPVSDYLGYTASQPENSVEFIDRVAQKNIASLVSITEKYGYPSPQRIKINFEDKKNLLAVIFVSRINKIDKKLKKLMKTELKLGNISSNEYENFRFYTNNRN